eukprot:355199-Hanusia_phi.AAC.1
MRFALRPDRAYRIKPASDSPGRRKWRETSSSRGNQGRGIGRLCCRRRSASRTPMLEIISMQVLSD